MTSSSSAPVGISMLRNRSMPSRTVIPRLAHFNMGEAIEWLCGAFGFTECRRAGVRRAQRGRRRPLAQSIADAAPEGARPPCRAWPTPVFMRA